MFKIKMQYIGEQICLTIWQGTSKVFLIPALIKAYRLLMKELQ